MGFCKTRIALAAAALAFTAACGDSGPSEFDAAGMQGDLAVIEGLGSDPTLTQLGATFAGIENEFGGAVLGLGALENLSLTRAGNVAAASAMHTFFRKGGATAINASLGSIPPEVAGKTFVYDEGTTDWVASDRTGAPASGVRFILYAVDGFGDIVSPLVETGHVDLIDQSNGSELSARLTAVSGGQTKADYTATVTGTSENGTMTVAGYIGTGVSRLDLDFAADVATSGDVVTYEVDSRLEFPGHDVVFDVTLSGTSNDVAGTYTAELAQLVESPNGRIELSGEFQPETHLTIRVNGDVYATYDGDGDTLTGANGRTLTTDEHEALFGAVYALELTIIVPVFVSAPMMWIIGDMPAIF